jgi:hypothetical protein
MNQEKRYMVIQMFPFVCKHVQSNLTIFVFLRLFKTMIDTDRENYFVNHNLYKRIHNYIEI